MDIKSLIIKLLQKHHRLNWLVTLTTSFCEGIKKPPHKPYGSWGGNRQQRPKSSYCLGHLVTLGRVSTFGKVVGGALIGVLLIEVFGRSLLFEVTSSRVFDPIIFSKVQPVCIFRSMDYLNPPASWLYQRLCLCCLLKKIVEALKMSISHSFSR